jgi:hypothetical protein
VSSGSLQCKATSEPDAAASHAATAAAAGWQGTTGGCGSSLPHQQQAQAQLGRQAGALAAAKGAVACAAPAPGPILPAPHPQAQQQRLNISSPRVGPTGELVPQQQQQPIPAPPATARWPGAANSPTMLPLTLGLGLGSRVGYGAAGHILTGPAARAALATAAPPAPACPCPPSSSCSAAAATATAALNSLLQLSLPEPAPPSGDGARGGARPQHARGGPAWAGSLAALELSRLGSGGSWVTGPAPAALNPLSPEPSPRSPATGAVAGVPGGVRYRRHKSKVGRGVRVRD